MYFLTSGRVDTEFLFQVSERDDKLLAEHMAKLRQDNEEVSGDEDSEEEEDTGMGEVDVDNGSAITEWKKKRTCGYSKASMAE